MTEQDRRQTVADVLRPVLGEGEAFNVYCHEGDVWVSEIETSVCAARYPRLYGRLLSLNAELERAGTAVARLPILLAVVFCVGVHVRWWDAWLGQEAAERLDTFWFYALVALAVYQLLSLVTASLERGGYRRHRDDLLALTAAEGLDRDLLLAMIEGDGAVGRVGAQLKLDRDAASTPTQASGGR